jgi:hypothetical protein
MRVMFTIAVLLTGIACISRAEAQVCGGDCNRCLVYARGECIKRGADPVCETRKKRCLARQKAPMGPPKPATTAAPRPNAARPTNARPNYRSYRPNAGPPPQRVERPTAAPPAPSVVPPTADPPAPSVVRPAPVPPPQRVERPTAAPPAPRVVPPTAGPRPAAVPPPPTAAPAPRLVPARVYLRAADIPPPSIGAYGVVALRSKPTPANRERLLRTCMAYRASLPPQKTLPSSIPPSNQMLTIWPLDEPDASDALKDDCDFAVDHYDLAGGILAIQDASLHRGANLEGIGPFLIGWSPSNARGVPDEVVLIFDLSRLESQASFDEAFAIWQKRIVENPTLWVSGFSAVRIRLALRDFVDHYGTDVVKIWGRNN